MQLWFTQVDPVPPDVAAQLNAKGWQVGHLPLRKVTWLEVDIPWSEVDLVVLSSKQAAQWLVAHLPSHWPSLAVVGATTAAMLPRSKLLFENPPAHAAELVERLRPRLALGTRLLFLRGEKVQDAIPNGLVDFDLRQAIVYRTEKNLEICPPSASPAMVYFQAPGTVADYSEAFRQPPSFVGAIGPTTARALAALGWQVDFQPSRPENPCIAQELPPPSAFARKNWR